MVALLAGLVPSPEQICSVVVVPTKGMERPLIDAHIASAREQLADLTEPFRAAGIDAPTRVLVGRPVEAILKTAKELGSQALAVGSFGKTAMEEILRGSLSADLTRAAQLPVLSVRFGILSERSLEDCAAWGRGLYSRVLHPTDLSDCSRRALDLLVHGRAASAVEKVELVHVIDDVYQHGESGDDLLATSSKEMDEYAATLHAEGVDCSVHVVEGDPVADVLRLAGELDASCIVLGSRGKGLVQEAMVGSVSQGILRLANKPVLVVH